MGGSEWIAERMRRGGLLSDTPGSAADTAGSFTGGLLGLLAGVKPDVSRPVNALMRLAEAPVNGKISFTLSGVRASKTPNIFDPKPTAQRQFNADYPQGVAGPDGSRLTLDIDGRPITAQYIAGRRVGGGVDEGIPRGDSLRIADLLGIRWGAVPRSGAELKGDAGRRIGFSNALFSYPMAPRTRQSTALGAFESVFGGGCGLLGVDSAAKIVRHGRRLRVIPCHQAACIGPAKPRTQSTPAALVVGSPERSRLGSLRPLAAPGHGLAPEAVPAPADPGG